VGSGAIKISSPVEQRYRQHTIIRRNPMNNDNKNGDKNPGSNLVSLGKDLVALLRDFTLFALAFLLLLFPKAFNTVLVNAGFEEGSIVGFKWKSKLIESDAALKEAQATITDLRSQLDKMSQTLTDAHAKLNDPSLKDQISKLDEENKQLKTASSSVEASVAATIASNASLVEKAHDATSSNTVWGVVFGGDAKLDVAKYEVEVTAPKLGLPNASVYFRQGYYRSVSVVGNRSDAERVRYAATKKRPDAYVVDMSTWCPRNNEKPGYRECLSP
jgi:seryl-tRNA synthetase